MVEVDLDNPAVRRVLRMGRVTEWQSRLLALGIQASVNAWLADLAGAELRGEDRWRLCRGRLQGRGAGDMLG